jgi:hypothetical protein
MAPPFKVQLEAVFSFAQSFVDFPPPNKPRGLQPIGKPVFD